MDNTPSEARPFTILLLGEGNLSFSYSLVKKLSKSKVFQRFRPDAVENNRADKLPLQQRHCRVVATTFDSINLLKKKYPETIPILNYFSTKSRIDIQIRGDVNATCIPESLGTDTHSPFHLIIFNNPHIGFEDFIRHRSLLSHFFTSARSAADRTANDTIPSEIVVALCDTQPQRWDLLGAAKRAGLICVAAVPLTSTEFPYYSNKRHQSDSSFPYKDMVQYYFMRSEDCSQVALELQNIFHQHDVPKHSIEEWEQSLTLLPEREIRQAHHCGNINQTLNDCYEYSCMWVKKIDPCPNFMPENFVFPLLNSSLAFYASCCDDLSMIPGKDANYCPYIAPEKLCWLYNVQLLASKKHFDLEVSEHPLFDAVSDTEECVPPHLDAAIIGRKLTVKEEAKLKRYIARQKTAKYSKCEAPTRHSGDSIKLHSFICYECEKSTRYFSTSHDLYQHQLLKHRSDCALLHPNMYASGHCHIARKESEKNDESDIGVHCQICGLVFIDRDAYMTHLSFLTPRKPFDDVKTTACCFHCSPPKSFVDERALQQHHLSTHNVSLTI